MGLHNRLKKICTRNCDVQDGMRKAAEEVVRMYASISIQLNTRQLHLRYAIAISAVNVVRAGVC